MQMVQSVIKLEEHQDRVLNVVKGKYGFKNKSQAVGFLIDEYEEKSLEPGLRPEYVKKIKDIDKKGKFKKYSGIDELRKEIENA